MRVLMEDDTQRGTRAAGDLSVREPIHRAESPPRYYFITRPIIDMFLFRMGKKKH